MKVSQGVLAATTQALKVGKPESEIAERLTDIILTGEMTDSQFDAYASWMCRHKGDDGRHDYELLGGATGTRWLDGLMAKAAALEAPEVEETEPVIEDVISGAIDYLNMKEQSAFKRLWTALEMTAKSALRRSVAKAAGTIRNEEVKARMASAVRPLDEIDDNLWQSAKLDLAATHIIQSSVDDALEEAQLILDEEATLLPRMIEVLGLRVRPRLLEDQERGIVNAVAFLRDELPDAIERWVRPRDGEPEFVLSPAVVRHAMLLAGGAEAIEDGFPVRKGHPVAAGFGMLNGPILFEQLRGFPSTRAAALFPDDQLKIAYKWRHAYYRDPETPFAPHKQLNGRVFLLENWEKLQSRRKDPDEFPATDPVTGESLEGYRVGDHEHCTCAAIPRFESQGGEVYGSDWFDARLSQEPKAAAFNSLQPRCPVGTGRTAGRFSNDMLTNCNPMVTQLKDRHLAGRIRSLRDDLDQGGLSLRQELKLREELDLAREEVKRREAGGKHDDETSEDGVADDPTENTQGMAEYADVTVEELNELAVAQGGGFTVRGGHDSPTEGFGVADPEHTLAISDWGELDNATQDAIIAKYLHSKEESFVTDPDIYLGAWVNDDGIMFLDLTKVVSDRQEAIDLGMSRGEEAIFGFDGFETIPTGGTGNEQRLTTGQAFLSSASRGDGSGDGEAGSGGAGEDPPAVAGPPREYDTEKDFQTHFAPLLKEHGWTPEDPIPFREIETKLAGLAEGIHSEALSREANLTAHMEGIANHVSGELYSLEYAVKGTGSTLRKLRDRHVKKGMELTREAAIEAIKDANRYTIVIPDNDYAKGVTRSVDTFEQSGFKLVAMENSWEQGDAYSGVHAILANAAGAQMEVQWHTPASAAIKDIIHVDYEEFRNSNDPVRKRELFDRMATQWDTAPAPGGWPPLTLNTFGDRAELLWRGPPDLTDGHWKPPITAAAGGGNPYHCPAGTGETSGRFTDAMGGTCNPQTSQLSAVGLQQRKANLEQLLAGDVSTERRARLEEEVRRVDNETQLRETAGQPEGDGISVEPDEVNTADAEEGDGISVEPDSDDSEAAIAALDDQVATFTDYDTDIEEMDGELTPAQIKSMFAHYEMEEVHPGVWSGIVDGEIRVVGWDGQSSWFENSHSSPEQFVWGLDVSDLEGEIEEDFNNQFWQAKQGVFHATTEENLEGIREEGLLATNETRGGTNRWIGNAVFTSTEGPQDAYGDVALEIDTAAMAADNYRPFVRQEPGFAEAEARGSVAHAIGIEDFVVDMESGLAYDTVIFPERIPVKYLSIDGEPLAKTGSPTTGDQEAVDAALARFGVEADFVGAVNFEYDQKVEDSLKDFRASLATPGPEQQQTFKAAEEKLLANPRIATLVNEHEMIGIYPVLPEAPFNGAMIRTTGARGVVIREFIAVNESGVEEVPDGPIAGVNRTRDETPFAVDQSLEGIMRHEYAHYLDRAAAPEDENRLSSSREFFDADVEGKEDLRRMVSEYSSVSEKEAHSELFSIVTHPDYDRSDFTPPESFKEKRPGTYGSYARIRTMLDLIENHYFGEANDAIT